MKKFIAMITLAMVVLIGIPQTVSALENVAVPDTDYSMDTTREEFEIVPFYEHTNGVTAGLTISSKTATCEMKVTGASGVSKISSYLYLERKVNGKWETFASWSESVNKKTHSMSKTKTLTSGYEYRVRVSSYVYKGSKSETVSATSAAKKCN